MRSSKSIEASNGLLRSAPWSLLVGVV
jgi:hypothetical protein